MDLYVIAAIATICGTIITVCGAIVAIIRFIQERRTKHLANLPPKPQPPIPPKASTNNPKPLVPLLTRKQFLIGAGVLGLGFAGVATYEGITHLVPILDKWRLTPIPKIPPGTTLITYRGHPRGVTSVSWSPDGKFIASGNEPIYSNEPLTQQGENDDNSVHVWDATNGKLKYKYHKQLWSVNDVAWSPDGRLIASSDDNYIYIWTASNGNVKIHLGPYSADYYQVAWSPDSKFLAFGGNDSNADVSQYAYAFVMIYDVLNEKLVPLYKEPIGFGVNSVSWSPDGNNVAAAVDNGTVKVWDITSKDIIFNLQMNYKTFHAPYTIIFCNNNKSLAISYDNIVQVWDILSGKKKFEYKGHSDLVSSIVYSAKNNYIASGSADKTVQIWDAATGNRRLIYRGHSDGVASVAWSPDGKKIASGSADKTVKVWVAYNEDNSGSKVTPTSTQGLGGS